MDTNSAGHNSIVLTHLGESVPGYMQDCVKQIRLWNPSVNIYVLLDDCHTNTDFFNTLTTDYNVKLVFRSNLQRTPEHLYFLEHFNGDMSFRKGYWRHVKERFFLIQELMKDYKLTNIISMEYDVLLYINIDSLIEKLKESKCIRMVRDNDDKGHPAFLFIPTTESIRRFNNFLISIIHTSLEDMQSLAAYAENSNSSIKYFPVITEARNKSIEHRRSKMGHTSNNPFYLSDDFSLFNILFDSLVVGQWVGGIDSRNTGGQKIAKYENESALYSIYELTFEWKKNTENFLWQPILDGRVLATIHVHSKALSCFLSDRSDYPKDDYDVEKVNITLLPN